jgi:LmbE family N-acetylglucosaminyl deacetylase
LLPTPDSSHPLSMTNRDRKTWRHVRSAVRFARVAQSFLLLALVFVGSLAQAPAEQPSVVDPLGVDSLAVTPLSQDTGTAGLKEMLRRLNTTARLMQTVAHPDDEDGGMLTLESRGKGDTVLLLTLNRGEGGQNKVGSNLFDVLGVLRTLELMAADRYYGVEQRFTRVADFGFSKTADETFQKWQGHDIALGDMVRVIRTFQPDVLVARFSGTDRDGHGHHQASSILTREAFRAAADPNRFPEQIKEGLLPWQAKKLYIGNVCGFGAKTCPDENYTVKLNTGNVDPLLGMSYVQFAMEGLRHQLSQGAGGWSVEPGDRFTFYKLVDSVLPTTTDKDGHEKDLFDGIDTSLPGLAARLGAEQTKVRFLTPALVEIQGTVKNAATLVNGSPAKAADELLSGLERVRLLEDQIKISSLSTAAKRNLLHELATKEDQFEKAANLAAGIGLHVSTDISLRATADDAFTAAPGQSFDLTAHFVSNTKVNIQTIALDLPPGWAATKTSTAAASIGKDFTMTFRVMVPGDAQFTRPYWHRADPETDAINTIDDPRYLTLPFPPPPVQAHATYSLDGKRGIVHAVATVKFEGNRERPVAVTPAFSVALEPGQQVISTEGDGACKVKVAVTSNLPGLSMGVLHLETPAGWRVEPARLPVRFDWRGVKRESEFNVFHDDLKEGRTEIRADLVSASKRFSEGYSVVTRDDLDTFYYYQPAVQRISVVDVKVPKDLKVGYLMGAGDDIPTVLKQIGMDVTLIPAEKLATEDLSHYGTIVLGIRAYDTQKDLATENKKLLDYVSAGGTLVVQYNTGVGDFNAGNFTPYSAQLSRERVSVEDAPVEILAPDDSVFHFPNQITPRDFDGWVQERGLYFMDHWDDHFKSLLACHDPGEPPQKGGLLRAEYGKGTYIYTGYAFFRQLPAGVPGAIRLYVNLLNAGHEKNKD